MPFTITDEIVALTRQLVQIHSQNGVDSEKKIAQFVFNTLVSFGFTPKIIGFEGHPSVICSINKPNAKKTIWLESCLDTVVAGDKRAWKFDPFAATLEGNKMYGRGTADCKIGIALFCILAKTLYKDSQFQGNLFLGFDADEQGGGFSGIRDIIKTSPKADICILGYQSNSEISIGARGWFRLKIITKGVMWHTGSRQKRGVNAIHKMGEVINALSNLSLPVKKDNRYFYFGSSLNISIISGGRAINIMPDSCEAHIDIRVVPSQSDKSVLDLITNRLNEIKKIDNTFSYSIEVLQYEPAYQTDDTNRFIRLLQTNARERLHKETPLVVSGLGSVGNVISRLSIPIVNAFGVEGENPHAPNEWINIDTIEPVFEIYKKTLIEFSNNT